MRKVVKKHKKEIGLSPDELYFRGDKKMDNVLLRLIDFDANNFEEKLIHNVDDVFKYQDKNTVTWFNIDGIHDPEIIEEIANGFNFDTLILANVMDTHARPRIYEHENCIFASLKMLKLDERKNQIIVENLSLILTHSVLITFQELKGGVFEPVRERIRTQKKRIRNSGTDYLMFSLLDIVIDNYIYVISEFAEKTEDLEEKLISNPNQSVIDEINSYKKELNYLRKNINPAKEMIVSLSKLETDLINKKTYIHLKELVDNMNHAVESTDNIRDILSDQLNIYHSTMSTKLNDVMKFLTVFSVIFIPITFITGVYGTNFHFLPELQYKYGYFLMWASFVVIVIGMLLYFKRKKWL
ncbi:MAG: magnesium/cobalt transporter CorA [Bacteroidales bacterium]|nr:magnesium/cobalt transporter CorA [Bacteroidales bacterium]